MNFNFPRAKFADSNTIEDQVLHIVSESIEAANESDPELQAMEIMDCLHSCETALRILEEQHGIGLDSIIAEVEHKNRVRGYYESYT